jgi:hypothetical protein
MKPRRAMTQSKQIGGSLGRGRLLLLRAVSLQAQVVPDRVARDRDGIRVPGDHEIVSDRVAAGLATAPDEELSGSWEPTLNHQVVPYLRAAVVAVVTSVGAGDAFDP